MEQQGRNRQYGNEVMVENSKYFRYLGICEDRQSNDISILAIRRRESDAVAEKTEIEEIEEIEEHEEMEEADDDAEIEELEVLEPLDDESEKGS